MACVAEASSTVTSGRTGVGFSAAGADSVSVASSAGAGSAATSVSADATSAASTSAPRRPQTPRQPVPRQRRPLGPWPSSPRQIQQACHRTRARRQASARYPWRTLRTQSPRDARRLARASRLGLGLRLRFLLSTSAISGHLSRSLPLSAFPIHDTPPCTKKTAPKDRLSHRFTASDKKRCNAPR